MAREAAAAFSIVAGHLKTTKKGRPFRIGLFVKNRELSGQHRAERNTNREVPIDRERLSANVHQWLDGELPEAAVRSPALDRQVELWKSIGADLQVRRRIVTPAGSMERIMAALPQSTPTVITPWHARPMEVTPVVAGAAGAGLLAVGVALGAVLAR